MSVVEIKIGKRVLVTSAGEDDGWEVWQLHYDNSVTFVRDYHDKGRALDKARDLARVLRERDLIYPRNVVRKVPGFGWAYFRQFHPRGELHFIMPACNWRYAYDSARRSAIATLEAMAKPGPKKSLW
jgi:hypothetical protein